MAGIQILNVSLYDAIRSAINDLVVMALMIVFFDKMYQRKFIQNSIYFLAYFISVSTALAVSCIGSSPLNAIYTILLMNGIALILYIPKSKMHVLYNSFFAIIAVFADVMTTSLLAALSNKTISETIGVQLSMYISCLVSWLILLLSNKLLIIILKKEDRNIVKFKELIFFIFITTLEIAITAYILSFIEGSSSGIVLAIFLICFFVLDIYIIYLIHGAARSIQLKYELELAKQQVHLQLKHYKEMLTKQEKAQSAIHDAKKHMLAVEGLFLNDSREKAEEYTILLCNKFDELTFDFKCSNQILGIIVSTKLQEAEKSNIKLNTLIEDISIDFISDFDITAIFANLLDNSFEECYTLPNELRWVKLLLKRKNNFLVINVINPIRTSPTPMNGIFKTTKKGHFGMGLSNVLVAVEKYKGNFIVEVEEGNFIASITIPIS